MNTAQRIAISIVPVALLLAGGCASLPEDVERVPSSAFTRPETTYLGRYFADGMATHPGENGFVVLDSGEQALLARLAIVEVAEHSIDAQYFIWHGDDSGLILMDALLRAAERGVRVRLLIDDAHAQGQDLGWTRIDALDNVEVRIFNPFGSRRSTLSRAFEGLGRLRRLQHRMHNKLLAVDGQVGIVGGRNIGDEYFGVDPKDNFRDLDVLGSGPVVPHLLEGFDAFWNSEWAYPITVFKSSGRKRELDVRVEIADELAKLDDFPYPVEFTSDDVKTRLGEIQDGFVWAPAQAVFDVPTKVAGEASFELVDTLARLTGSARTEILVSSPYFSPEEETFTNIAAARERGVIHRLLTNSAVSGNIPPAHAVYRKYRKRLLKSGVQIHELQPEPELRQSHVAPVGAQSKIGLHAKTVVVDRESVFIGSYNFNKAGALLSTETALVISSPVLAEQIGAIVDDMMRPENSWQVILDPPGKPDKPKSGKVVWIGSRDGRQLRFTGEPYLSFGRRIGLWFYSTLPLKNRI